MTMSSISKSLVSPFKSLPTLHGIIITQLWLKLDLTTVSSLIRADMFWVAAALLVSNNYSM